MRARSAEERLDQVRHGGLAEEADAQRGQRDAELAGRQVAREVVDAARERRARRAGPPRPSSSSARAARAHERELRGDEEPVQQHEHDDREEEQAGHAGAGGASRARRYFGRCRRRSSGRRGAVLPDPAQSRAISCPHRCASSRSSPRPPRCCSPSAWATRSPPSRTSATTRAEALDLPKVTRDVIGPGLPPAEIDRAVRELTEQGAAIYELDEAARCARSQPDLIVTQALCAVCAVSYDDVRAIARADGARAGGHLARPAHARRGARRRPHARRRRPTRRTPASTWCRTPRAGSTASGWPCAAPSRCRVAALEWLDPVFVAGHWTPQLIEYAGGVDVLGLPGEHSEVRTLGGGRRRPARGRRRDAVRLRRRARARGGLRLRATSSPSSAPGASSRSTPPPTSPAPARGCSTGSSCWPTSCTPTACPRRPAPVLEVAL